MEIKDRPIMFFIGVLLLLVGLYGTLKTVVNLVVFERYPLNGVYEIPFSAPDPYGTTQREQDCEFNYSYIPVSYYDADGYIRGASETERAADETYKAQQEINKQTCIEGVKEARKESMVNDISQSLIFLLLAMGMLTFGRVFRKTFLNIKI